LLCRAANAADERHRRHTREPRLVPTTDLRVTIQTLRAKGIGLKQIARLAQVSLFTISSVASGRSRRVRRNTAERIRTIRPVRAASAKVSAWRSRRLVEALVAEGYSIETIRARARLSRFVMSRLVQRQLRVYVSTQSRLAMAHDAMTT